MDGKTPLKDMTDREIAVETLEILRGLEDLLTKYEPLLDKINARKNGLVGKALGFGG